jgi:transcriptional regulator with XRE-family HTH domain
MDVGELVATARLRRSIPEPSTRRLIRVAAGLSQEEVAAAVGVTAAALSRWETGRRHPRGQARDRYAHVLGSLRELGQERRS